MGSRVVFDKAEGGATRSAVKEDEVLQVYTGGLVSGWTFEVSSVRETSEEVLSFNW
jgi:FKBP-type peptidyl-prolyl cis-trans isomerase